MQDTDQHQLNSYLKQIESYLPFDQQKTNQILEEFKLEVEEATEGGSKTPRSLFGDPKETAINLVQVHQDEKGKASLISRFVAYGVDSIVIGILLIIVIGIPYLIISPFYDFSQDPSSGWELFIVITYSIYGIAMFVLCASLYIVPEKIYTQSIGKKLLGLQVLDEAGIKITWKQALTRNLVKFQMEFIWLDLVMGILMGEGIQRGSDLIAKTKVVRK